MSESENMPQNEPEMILNPDYVEGGNEPKMIPNPKYVPPAPRVGGRRRSQKKGGRKSKKCGYGGKKSKKHQKGGKRRSQKNVYGGKKQKKQQPGSTESARDQM